MTDFHASKSFDSGKNCDKNKTPLVNFPCKHPNIKCKNSRSRKGQKFTKILSMNCFELTGHIRIIIGAANISSRFTLYYCGAEENYRQKAQALLGDFNCTCGMITSHKISLWSVEMLIFLCEASLTENDLFCRMDCYSWISKYWTIRAGQAWTESHALHKYVNEKQKNLSAN